MLPAFCHPLPNELFVGTIYGFVALLALARSDFSAWRSVAWLFVIVVFGYWMLQACHRFLGMGEHVPLNQVFVLGILAGSCRFAADFNRRFDQWNRPDRDVATRQFGIGGLLWLTTCMAIVMLLVKQTTLIDRGATYWVGLFTSIAIFSLAFSRHPFGLTCVAGILAFGFAIIDARGVQPDELEFRSAMIRYAGLLFGMILPRLVWNEFSLGLLARLVAPKPDVDHLATNHPTVHLSSTDEPTTLTQDRNDVPTPIEQINSPQAHTENASVGPAVVGVNATDQTQPTLRVVY